MRARTTLATLALSLSTLPFAVGCSGTSGPAIDSTNGALSGPVEIRAVNDDRSTPVPLPPELMGLAHVTVTVARVDARVDARKAKDHDDDRDAWVTVATGPFTIDLLSLENGTFASLGVVKLPAGETEALRLVLGASDENQVVMTSGQTFPLIVPSGEAAGIRVVGDFDVSPCATGVVTLQFAGRHAIELHPDGDHDAFVLRPVIRVREVVVNGSCPSMEGEPNDEQHHEHGLH